MAAEDSVGPQNSEVKLLGLNTWASALQGGS
jgi:hypothetical protein